MKMSRNCWLCRKLFIIVEKNENIIIKFFADDEKDYGTFVDYNRLSNIYVDEWDSSNKIINSYCHIQHKPRTQYDVSSQFCQDLRISR